ncbi:hypothetical protein ElyMa_006914300, partial [Elysia marginata]
QISRHRSKWYFIGLRDKYKNGTYFWLDNDKERTLFTSWEYARYKGIRHLEGRHSDCVVMNSKLSKGWQTASCWVWKRFICEKYSDCKNQVYGMLCAHNCAETNCGGQWRACDRYNGSCYHGCQPGYTGRQCRQKVQSQVSNVLDTGVKVSTVITGVVVLLLLLLPVVLFVGGKKCSRDDNTEDEKQDASHGMSLSKVAGATTHQTPRRNTIL